MPKGGGGMPPVGWVSRCNFSMVVEPLGGSHTREGKWGRWKAWSAHRRTTLWYKHRVGASLAFGCVGRCDRVDYRLSFFVADLCIQDFSRAPNVRRVGRGCNRERTLVVV